MHQVIKFVKLDWEIGHWQFDEVSSSKLLKQFHADSYERQVELEYAIDNNFVLPLGKFSANILYSLLLLSAEYLVIYPGDGPVAEAVSILGLLLTGCAVGGASGGL